MSQQKVDYHKEQKRNRRQIMKKEKTMRRLEITILIVVLAALVVWFAYLVYTNRQGKNAGLNIESTEMDLSAWESYTENMGALARGEEIEEEPTGDPADEAAEEAEEPAAESTEEVTAESTEETAAESTEEAAAESAEETTAESEKAE